MALPLALALLAASAQDGDISAEQALVIGNAHYARGELERAKQAYAHCLSVAPDRTDCTTNLASVLVDLGSLELGEQLYRKVLDSDPGHADAAYNLAMLLQDHKTDESNREAAGLYRRALLKDPSRWDAWANLAAVLSDLGVERVQTIKAFQRAILLIEQAADANDGADSALSGYLASLYFGLGNALASLTPEQCAELAMTGEVLLVGVDAGGGVGESSKVCMENAQNALRTTLELDPSHVQAEHTLAALLSARGTAGLSKASPQFVTSLFDDFAASFDSRLAELRYEVPKLVGGAVRWLAEKRGEPFNTALDAGCGTGLAGPYLRPLVRGRLVGVDLSQKMLQRAATLTQADQQPIYDALLSKDLVALLPDELGVGDGATGRLDLIVAADVLVYFGELGELLGAFGKLLQGEGAAMIFSCERATEDAAPKGWRMLPSGRFAHTKKYVVSIASALNFALVDYHEIVPRYEGNSPVDGHLFVFVRTGDLTSS